jgi:hypothetical protein
MNIGKLDHEDEAPAELISGVLGDARDFAVAEVDKLKAEVKDVGEQVKIASVGLLVLTVAAILLGIALALGLVALGLPPWAAFLVMSVVCAMVGTTLLLKRRAIAHAT